MNRAAHKNFRFQFYSHVLGLQDLQKQDNSARLQALSGFRLLLFAVSPFAFAVLKLPRVADARFVSFHSIAVEDLPSGPVISGDSNCRLGKIV